MSGEVCQEGHKDHHGAVTTLRFVGCIDCGTESGAAHACCQGIRCKDCDRSHHAAPATVQAERLWDPDCEREPHEIPEYIAYAAAENMTPAQYVARDEGTLNRANGHFLCTDCYIKRAMPAGPGLERWVCP